MKQNVYGLLLFMFGMFKKNGKFIIINIIDKKSFVS